MFLLTALFTNNVLKAKKVKIYLIIIMYVYLLKGLLNIYPRHRLH